MLIQFRENDINDYYEAGIDEVARGCLFGPVFAAAVILDKKIPLHKWLNDSKKVTKKRRAVVRKWIEENAISWAVAYIENDKIDELNIRCCVLSAMEIAVRKLEKKPNLIIVDGDYFHGTNQFGLKDEQLKIEPDKLSLKQTLPLDIPHQTIVGGDSIYASIAAASILAKEHHDEFIKKMIEIDSSLDSRYKLSTNVGYGTPEHIYGLKTWGPTTYHRLTFLNKILMETQYFSMLKKGLTNAPFPASQVLTLPQKTIEQLLSKDDVST